MVEYERAAMLVREWDGECPKCRHDVLDYEGQTNYPTYPGYGFDLLFRCSSCDTRYKMIVTAAVGQELAEGET